MELAQVWRIENNKSRWTNIVFSRQSVDLAKKVVVIQHQFYAGHDIRWGIFLRIAHLSVVVLPDVQQSLNIIWRKFVKIQINMLPNIRFEPRSDLNETRSDLNKHKSVMCNLNGTWVNLDHELNLIKLEWN